MRYLIAIGVFVIAGTIWMFWPNELAAPLEPTPVATTSTSVAPIATNTEAMAPVPTQPRQVRTCSDAGARVFSSAGNEERSMRHALDTGVTILCFKATGAYADYLEAFFIQGGVRGGSIDFLHQGDAAMRLRVRHAGGLTDVATNLTLGQWYQVELDLVAFSVRWRLQGGEWSAERTFSHVGAGPVSALELVHGNSGSGSATYYFQEL